MQTISQAAISALNGLQTNAAALELIRQQKGNPQVSEFSEMRQYLQRVGLTPTDLRGLKAIHVSGTKGKVNLFVACMEFVSLSYQQGSVCAMTESILRCHCLKTGLFT